MLAPEAVREPSLATVNVAPVPVLVVAPAKIATSEEFGASTRPINFDPPEL